MNARAGSQHGFTIIEILMVIVIMAALLTIAAPSFVTFTAGQRVKTASFDLYAAMMFARSEAIKRRANVTVTAAGGDWKNGWTVTTPDPANPGNTLTLRNQDAMDGVNFTNATTSVVYQLNGRLSANAAQGVLIQPQHADTSIKNRCIRIDTTGLPKSTMISTTTCP